ncbi:MAG: hypothetical protein AAFX87_07270 [Bacteroidota bacterium]
MDIKTALLAEHSRAQATRIADYVGDDNERLEELLGFFIADNYRLSQRAAWPFGICAERYPNLILPHLDGIVENLKKTVHDAVKRNTIRFLQFIDIPEHLLGEIAEICFNYLGSAKEPIAVKVFSMTVIFNIVKKEPELKPELEFMIEEQMPYGSAGFKSRGKKILSALKKM